jgi:hypothetical protein
MHLAKPLFVALDSSTLGSMARDFWSESPDIRVKARTCVNALAEQCVHIVFTHSHVEELLRHGDQSVASDRMHFMRNLPLIAWIRPYHREWLVGSVLDVYAKEIDIVLRKPKAHWKDIVAEVRRDIWETGTGKDMFGDHQDDFWMRMREEYLQYATESRRIASMAKVDYGVSRMTLEDCRQTSLRSREELAPFAERLMENMKYQICKHGDKKWNEGVDEVIGDFTNDTLRRLYAYFDEGSDISSMIASEYGVAAESLRPDMTVSELGDLVVYTLRLKLWQRRMGFPSSLSTKILPIDSLPSYAFNRRMSAIQNDAERVAGSDLADADIAGISLYADKVGVDKRTLEYVRQLKNSNAELATLVGNCHFRVSGSDYSTIPQLLIESTS